MICLLELGCLSFEVVLVLCCNCMAVCCSIICECLAGEKCQFCVKTSLRESLQSVNIYSKLLSDSRLPTFSLSVSYSGFYGKSLHLDM